MNGFQFGSSCRRGPTSGWRWPPHIDISVEELHTELSATVSGRVTAQSKTRQIARSPCGCRCISCCTPPSRVGFSPPKQPGRSRNRRGYKSTEVFVFLLCPSTLRWRQHPHRTSQLLESLIYTPLFLLAHGPCSTGHLLVETTVLDKRCEMEYNNNGQSSHRFCRLPSCTSPPPDSSSTPGSGRGKRFGGTSCVEQRLQVP